LVAGIDDGDGTEDDLKRLDSVAGGMLGNTICVLADAAAMPVQSFITKFHDEFEAHIRLGGCELTNAKRAVA
jgi:NADH-quinone oxidoreductase subunit F